MAGPRLPLALLISAALIFLIAGVVPVAADVVTIPAGDGPRAIAVNPATGRVYTTNNDGNDLSIINGTTNTLVGAINLNYGARNVAVNPDAGRI